MTAKQILGSPQPLPIRIKRRRPLQSLQRKWGGGGGGWRDREGGGEARYCTARSQVSGGSLEPLGKAQEGGNIGDRPLRRGLIASALLPFVC